MSMLDAGVKPTSVWLVLQVPLGVAAAATALPLVAVVLQALPGRGVDLEPQRKGAASELRVKEGEALGVFLLEQAPLGVLVAV